MSRRRPAAADLPVTCFRCGDPYAKHARDGHCRAVDEDGRCPCLGFQWIDPAGPAPTY